jgi:hypothetical protein
MNYKQIIFGFIVTLFLVSAMAIISASSTATPTIAVTLATTPDAKEEIFYLSKNTEQHIFFNVNSNAFEIQPENNEYIVRYSLKISPEIQEQEIQLSLSEDEQIFLSEINAEIAITILSQNFQNKTIRAEVTAELFDSYNNLIDTSSKTITIIANNSEDDFTYTKTRAEPRFRGIEYSRNIAYLHGINDSDIISVKLVADYDYLYGLECNPSNKAISADVKYNDNTKYFDINLFIDSNTIAKGTYFLNCLAYNKDNRFNLKPIKINYMDVNSSIVIQNNTANKDSNTEVSKDTVKQDSKSTISSNISGFSILKSSSSLLVILVILIIVAILLA